MMPRMVLARTLTEQIGRCKGCDGAITVARLIKYGDVWFWRCVNCGAEVKWTG